jgi:hypothetical protein
MRLLVLVIYVSETSFGFPVTHASLSRNLDQFGGVKGRALSENVKPDVPIRAARATVSATNYYRKVVILSVTPVTIRPFPVRSQSFDLA